MSDTRINGLCSQLFSAFSYHPVMAAELECYVADLRESDDWWRPLHDQWKHDGIPLLAIEKERGDHQYELVLGINSPEGLLKNLNRLRNDILAHADHSNVKADFSAKPFAGQPASGLHLHLHLEDADRANVFAKSDEGMSKPLSHAIGGLIQLMPLAFEYYCPNDSDKARFMDADHVPRANCWGANNRYCAVRIPSFIDIYHKWVELRVPSSDADFSDAISAMLASVYMGLKENLTPPAQEYGKPDHRFLEDMESQLTEIPESLRAGFLALMQSHAEIKAAKNTPEPL